MKPRDISAMTTLSAPTLAPDRRTAVVAARSPDLDDDKYTSSLWIVTLDASAEPRRLTHGDRDSAPRYSPDGQCLAFLRPDDKKRPQVWLLPTAGGDARQLTKLLGGAGEAQWSPDSSRIAFSARVPAKGRHGTDEDIPSEKEPPRRITGLQYRWDNEGFVVENHEQVFVVDVAADEDAKQITDGDTDSGGVTWSPDGGTLAFISARSEYDDTLHNDVFVADLDGANARQVTDTSLAIARVRFTTDAAALLILAEDYGPDGKKWVAEQGGLFITDPESKGSPRRLTNAERYSVTDAGLHQIDDRAIVAYDNRGAVDLLATPLDGNSDSVTLAAGRRVVTGMDAVDDVIVVAYMDPSTTGELGRVDGETIVRLTDFGATLRSQTTILEQQEITAAAPDGQQLHGFLVVPDGNGPHPVLLMIHGGPFSQYTWSVFDEAQVYADAGYAVVYTNPRGSSGYGHDYGRHIIGDVGERSSTDLLALLDSALERPDLDDSRVGVLGGSHGGFMTSWLVGHTDRFKAAVSERAVNAIDSFTGSSDIGWGFADALYGTDLSQQDKQSPLTYADNISTPLLIIHSEHDWRCPVEQAQRLYVALKRRRATVEMLLFPGEGHEMSRSGLPSHRVARFDAILDWCNRYL